MKKMKAVASTSAQEGGFRSRRWNDGSRQPVTQAWHDRPAVRLPKLSRAGDDGRREKLSQDLTDHSTMHIGQAEVTPGVAIGQLLMVEPHEMQNGRV